jgi:hypothetical protein
MRFLTCAFLFAGAGLGVSPFHHFLDDITTPLTDIYFAAVASPFNLRISTTELSAIRVGHAAANAGPAVGPATKPTKMRHLCKNMQKAVQGTASRFLAIIGISGPSLSDTTPVPEGFSRVQITHHKFIPVPAFDPVFVIKAGDPQAGSHPDIALPHNMHNDSHPRGPFLHRIHRALLSLGPWEGRIVAFVLGAFFPLYVGLNRILTLT